MKKLAAVLLIIGWAAVVFADEEKPLTTRITSLGLFKNGLAVVQRTAKIERAGTYRVEDVPEPIHGTFWVESDASVSTRVTQRTVEVPLDKAMPGNIQEDLAGRDVVIHFAEQGIGPAEGTVLAIDPPHGSAAWNRRYEQPNYYYGYGAWDRYSGGNPVGSASSARFLLLKTKDGQSYIDSSKIAYLEAKGKSAAVRQRKAVLLFTVGELKQKNAMLSISYLAKGMAWAPSYRVDISDPKELLIRQSAVVKNELEPFADAQLRLISGFPSVQFGHVISPLSPDTTWANFFQQLNQRIAEGRGSMITQQVVASNSVEPNRGLDLNAIPTGEGVDLYYQDINQQTLDEGDSLAVETASGKAIYDRIVEWIIPDTRQANGRYIDESQRQNEPDKYQDAVWDAVRFRNPFGFPMTTAPAMFVADGKFNGQQMSYWVNSGEETTLHITKALSVRTRSVEQEVDNARDLIYIAGEPFRKITLEGTILANNHRNEQIALVIRRRFSGELASADKDPKISLLEEGAGYINKRNQLTWSSTLKPGEEVKLVYRYTLLVRQ
ncbi:MAG: hypothetical protein ABSG67_14890 [Thermoguttaceae bacterium]|jgi:hypothetical protein